MSDRLPCTFNVLSPSPQGTVDKNAGRQTGEGNESACTSHTADETADGQQIDTLYNDHLVTSDVTGSSGGGGGSVCACPGGPGGMGRGTGQGGGGHARANLNNCSEASSGGASMARRTSLTTTHMASCCHSTCTSAGEFASGSPSMPPPPPLLRVPLPMSVLALLPLPPLLQAEAVAACEFVAVAALKPAVQKQEIWHRCIHGSTANLHAGDTPPTSEHRVECMCAVTSPCRRAVLEERLHFDLARDDACSAC